MSIWGRILDGAAGLFGDGPIGRLLSAVSGAVSGNAVAKDGTQSIAFTIGVIVLSAKMAKVDGTVKRVEVETFKRLFQVAPEELKNVGRVFDLARRDANGFEVYARQIARLFEQRDAVLEELLENLLRIAEADDDVHDEEIAYLREVARIFGFGDADFDRILAEHCMTCGKRAGDPYTALGVSRGASDEEIKAAYRRLAHEHHPDRLLAQGLPPEFAEVATAKMAAINAAYDQIRRERAPA